MTKENVLFSIIGILLGYVVGFTFVVYVNGQSQTRVPVSSDGDEQSQAELPAEHRALPDNSVKDQQTLKSGAQQAGNDARNASQDFDAQMRAAVAWGNANNFEEAIDYLTRANELRPDDYETLVNLGNANFEVRRYEIAEKWYLAALSKKPEDVNVRSDLGLTYFVREPSQPDKAIAEFRRVLNFNPEHIPTLRNLTLTLLKTGDVPEAERTLARLQKSDPNYTDMPRLREELEKARANKTSTSTDASNKNRKAT